MINPESWGRFPRSICKKVVDHNWPFKKLPTQDAPLIAYAQGRSYGDACLNSGGTLITTKNLNRLLNFDKSSGLLECEAGVTLAEILKFALPLGWFLPVTPGTKFVSVGGAIANDIHGKNHHVAGNFGHHIDSLVLLRSDGQLLNCSTTENSEIFYATIGGIGLTGLIISAKIRLKKVMGPYINMDSIKFGSLDEFFALSGSSDKNSEYTVAWLDCIASNNNFGRGIFMRGDHAEIISTKNDFYKESKISIPFDLPQWCLNPLTVKAFNTCYYHKQQSKSVSSTVHYEPFFYPLDSVLNWNRIYGKNGFLQFQCVVPKDISKATIEEILKEIVKSQSASFLAVLKEFGEKESLGLMSFPRSGTTLCLDFANRGQNTLDLFRRLHDIVYNNGGAIYPAKDACMNGKEFRKAYPKIDAFRNHIDPAFSSELWRRVSAE